MKIQKSAIICCFAAAGLLFASCKKDTPRTEQKVDNPSTPTTQPEKPTPPAPKPEDPKPPVPQPEAPKAAGEARIEVAKAGGLEAALKGEDLEKLTKLVVTSGTLNQADLNFITKSLKIEEIDLTNATLSLQEEDKGFYNNSTLKKIIAPANLEKTQKDWFSNTMATEFVFPGNKLRVFGGAVYNEKLKSIVLPNSVEELGDAPFSNSNFESITLSSSLKVIPAEAFKGCRRLTKLVIPASVIEIKDNVFTGCSLLKDVIFLCPAPKFTPSDIDENAFDGYDYSIDPKFTVPKGTKADYLKALGLPANSRGAKRFVEAE